MNILAIDASTAVLSLVLKTGKDYYQYNTDRGFKHSELIMPGVDYLFKEAGLKPNELDLICTALGPGSFTGLRVGMSTAKGIAAGTDSPMVAVPTLDFLVEPLKFFPGIVIPLIDAKKGRFYSALYEGGERCTDFFDISPREIMAEIEKRDEDFPLLFTGPDCEMFRSYSLELTEKGRTCFFDEDCRRGNGLSLMKLGQGLYEKRGADSMDTGPLYMRKSEAEISLEKKQTTSS